MRLTKIEKLIDEAYYQQTRYINRRFGKHSADYANYGWYSIRKNGGEEIGTKVYGKGILITHVSFKSGEISHHLEEN